MQRSRSLGSLGGGGAPGGERPGGAPTADAPCTPAPPAPRSPPPWPTGPEGYEILDVCGAGVSGAVYLASCPPRGGERVAIKALNLEALPGGPDDIMREVAAMRRYSHPSVLPLFTSFCVGQELWVVTPFAEGGSVAHILRYRFPHGLAEPVIAALMKPVLEALAYVHRQNGIHRDVKAGNVLVFGDGRVALGDFGVAATMERAGDWGGSGPLVGRSTLVGTACWIAPEVLEQAPGYGTAADIWSFGITLLECAHGHAPFANQPPMKVLLMTLQGPPPTLEAECGGRHFSRALREVVALCLQKDPAKRPTAAQLLQHRLFRHAKDAAFVKRSLLEGLPPLAQRHAEIRRGAAAAATAAMENRRRAAASQALYFSDVAAWDLSVHDADVAGTALAPAGGSGCGLSSSGSADAASVAAAAADADTAGASPPAGAEQPEPGAGCAAPPCGRPLSFAARDVISRIATPPPFAGTRTLGSSPGPAPGAAPALPPPPSAQSPPPQLPRPPRLAQALSAPGRVLAGALAPPAAPSPASACTNGDGQGKQQQQQQQQPRQSPLTPAAGPTGGHLLRVPLLPPEEQLARAAPTGPAPAAAKAQPAPPAAAGATAKRAAPTTPAAAAAPPASDSAPPRDQWAATECAGGDGGAAAATPCDVGLAPPEGLAQRQASEHKGRFRIVAAASH